MPSALGIESQIKAIIFRGSIPKISNILKTLYIPTSIPFNMYSTEQEIDVSESFDDDTAEPMKIIFQPSKDEPKQYFSDWVSVDAFAENYWLSNFSKLKTEMGLNFGLKG